MHRSNDQRFKLLLLGGTSDGRKMAEALHDAGIFLIYSMAGLVRIPTVPYELVIGGFHQFGGLTQYLKDNHITAILDVTHPYAVNMSVQAATSTREVGIPYLRLNRLSWIKNTDDDWHTFDNWPALFDALKNKNRVFLTLGQLHQNQLETLATYTNQEHVLRTAVKPIFDLPKSITWIKAVGPFTEKDERALLSKFNIDAIVCKNSGGTATQEKLNAARKMNIPVFMLNRPELPQADIEFTDLDTCKNYMLNHNVET